MNESDASISAVAPADARQYPAWPIWKKCLAYFFLIALAALSIWFIDRGAMNMMNMKID